MRALFTPGNILFIKDYDFEDGGDTHDKLMVILYENNEEAFILQSLTTSQYNIRETLQTDLRHGCFNDSEKAIHFYFYDKNVNIGTYANDKKEFNFNSDTMVHIRNNVTKMSTLNLLKYKDISFLAYLYDYELKSIIKCISNSKYCAREIKDFLKTLL